MQISDLIDCLTRTAMAHGDLPVYVLDGGCEFPLEEELFSVNKPIFSMTAETCFNEKPKRLRINVV